MDKAVIANKLNLDILLNERSPYGKFEIVDVKFDGADSDYTIRHSLSPEHPQDVQYQVLRQTTAGNVYENSDVDWTNNYIVLRATEASWTGRLLLSVLANRIPFNPLEL